MQPHYQPNTLMLNGKYRIEALVGQGSFGQVYRARHVRLDLLRALKVLHHNMDHVGSTALADYRKRFGLEAQLGAKIKHPNVIEVYDFVEDGDGALVLEMEYVTGGSLADTLSSQKRLDHQRVLQVLRDCLAGLTVLHEHALGTFVHRDLKPSNILLDATGRAKIADLGSAQTPWDNPSRLGTLAPPHPGTAGYRSPEHEIGHSLLSPSADVYGLGCVAFELLSGKRWFDAQRSARGVRDLQADVPAWLDEIVMRMLRKPPGLELNDRADANKRYVDCADVLAALQAGLDRAEAERNVAAAAEAARLRQAQAEKERVAHEQARIEAAAQAAAEAETARQQALTQQIAQHKRQTEAAISSARWGEVMRHARAWLALQPDSTQARAALRLAEEEQSKLTHARTRRALLLGGGGAGVLGLGYVASRLVPIGSGGATATPRPTDTPPTTTAVPVTPTTRPTDRLPTATAVPATFTPRPTDRSPTATAGPATLIPTFSAIKSLSDSLVEITLAPGVTMQFVRIPAGEFVMGSDKTKDLKANNDELPQHRLSLPEYWICKTEVTVAQFAVFTRAINYSSAASKDTVSKTNHPVVDVTWNDCMAFCNWVSELSKASVSLPSEAEWEKAARGPSTSSGDARIYPWGNEVPDATRCNFNYNEKDTTPVGKYGVRGASPYGCDDMAGNVWEWTRSEYKAYPYKADDGRENIQNTNSRVLRGGSFSYATVDVRCSYRNFNFPFSHNRSIGFRGSFARLPLRLPFL